MTAPVDVWPCKKKKALALAHNRKYKTGRAGEKEMNKTDAVRQQPSQLFIRCACRDEYSMKAPGPSLYAIHVHFSLTLKIICCYSSLQSGISRGKVTKWKMGYITLHCLPFPILLVSCTGNKSNMQDPLWLVFKIKCVNKLQHYILWAVWAAFYQYITDTVHVA